MLLGISASPFQQQVFCVSWVWSGTIKDSAPILLKYHNLSQNCSPKEANINRDWGPDIKNRQYNKSKICPCRHKCLHISIQPRNMFTNWCIRLRLRHGTMLFGPARWQTGWKANLLCQQNPRQSPSKLLGHWKRVFGCGAVPNLFRTLLLRQLNYLLTINHGLVSTMGYEITTIWRYSIGKEKTKALLTSCHTKSICTTQMGHSQSTG